MGSGLRVMEMKGVGLLLCAAWVLAACEREKDPELAFCRQFAEARLAGDAAETRIRDVRIEDRPIDAEEAVKMLYPGYVGLQGFGIRRSGHAWRMIYLVRALPAERRDILLELEVLDGGRTRRMTESCAFLHLDDVPQFISERHLQRLVMERAVAAADGHDTACCVPVDPAVR